MARGIDGQKVFRDDADRARFVALLGWSLEKTGCRCYAFSLMTTHYHLLLRQGPDHLGTTLRILNGAYASYYNETHRRRGYLFQDRYRSIPTRDLDYALELLRYIHLNPVRAGLSRGLGELARSQWCSHRYYCAASSISRPRWLVTQDLLRTFGRTVKDAAAGYLDYMRKGLSEAAAGFDPWRAAGETPTQPLEARLSSDAPEFVKRAVATATAGRTARALLLQDGWNIERVMCRAAELTGIDQHELLGQARRGSRWTARALICHWACDLLGVTAASVARFLGVHCSSVTRARSAGREIARVNRYQLTQ